MDQDEIKARFALIEKLNSTTFDRATQYDNTVVGVGFIGFFALWAGVSHDIPRWSALASAMLIGLSLTTFIVWTIVQMLGRHYATAGIAALLTSDDERDLTFAAKWEAAEAKNARATGKLLRLWSPIFYFSLISGLIGSSILASAAGVTTFDKLGQGLHGAAPLTKACDRAPAPIPTSRP